MSMSVPPLRILVSGMMAGDPHQGGATWAVLQFLLGFRRLGHDVCFVEPILQSSLRPSGSPLASTINAAYFQSVVGAFALEQKAALFRPDNRETVGLSYDQLCWVGRQADVFLNISGLLAEPTFTETIPVRVYLDLDPAFNQLWQLQGIDRGFAGHTHWVTIGQALGKPGCAVPLCGLPWLTTLQPVVLEHWPVAQRIKCDAFTTVGNWRAYGSIEQDGVFYGQKAHSLRQFISLPGRTPEKFMLALAIHPQETGDLEALAVHGWQLLDPAEVAGSPADYRLFIQGSKAELGIAKSGYVVSRCGWFSDRSICYLASGRPVLAQETGFSRFLPIGQGLFAFETLDDILAGIDAVNGDYHRHARAARAVAEEFFDSDKVLTKLLAKIGVGP
jgi:hypothetical protein